MNKFHATDSRTPPDAAAILAAHGSPFSDLWRGTVPHAIAPPEGARNPVRPPPIELCAQTLIQPEAAPVTPVGTLRNGNPRGNPNAAPRCGAKTHAGCPCKGPAMKNGRCRMRGGAGTGPSAEGRIRIAAARTTNGYRLFRLAKSAGRVRSARLRGRAPLFPSR